MTYFENLISRELIFQKTFLEQKNANSKLYFKGYQAELDSMGIVPREEMLNHFLILNDKATSKERNYEKEMKLDLEFKNKPKALGNMFKSVSRKIKEGKQIKNAVGKVLDKYLLAEKQAKEKRKQNPDKKEIKNLQNKINFKENNNLNLTQGKEI